AAGVSCNQWRSTAQCEVSPIMMRRTAPRQRWRCRMEIDWELREAAPRDAERTVLLLPGGLCGAGSYAEVMAEPSLARMRLVAATMPGHAGAPPPEDYGVPTW